jgi:hypothetical protein
MSESRFPEAFNGDQFIEAELRRLVDRWAVRTIVETGTSDGASARAFADMGPSVVTIEIEPSRRTIWTLGNVRQLVGDSPRVLANILGELRSPILFYLDAHWGGEHSPLLEELAAIAAAELPAPGPVIAIHDFKNPFQPLLGYDTHDIGEYNFALIAPLLPAIYPSGGCRISYNGPAAGQRRGIIYIEPEQKMTWRIALSNEPTRGRREISL